jgi:hypothetical protein
MLRDDEEIFALDQYTTVCKPCQLAAGSADSHSLPMVPSIILTPAGPPEGY